MNWVGSPYDECSSPLSLCYFMSLRAVETTLEAFGEGFTGHIADIAAEDVNSLFHTFPKKPRFLPMEKSFRALCDS